MSENGSKKSLVSSHDESSSSASTTGKSLPLKGGYFPPDSENVDVLKLLDQLDELPDQAWQLPFNTFVGFKKEQFDHLVLKIKANLPDEVKRANKIVRDGDRLVEKAKDSANTEMQRSLAEAARITDEAKVTAKRSLDEAAASAAKMVGYASGTF